MVFLPRMIRSVCLAAMLLVVAAPAFSQIDPDRISESWKTILTEFQTLIKSSAPDKEAKISAKMDKIFDYETMGDRALGGVQPQWQALDAPGKARFRAVFRLLIQGYYRRHLQACIANSTLTTSGATEVTRSTTDPKCSDLEPSAYTFGLKRVGNSLLIDDITADELNVIVTYKNQITKIVKNEGFEVLIQKIQKKVDDMRSALP